GLVPYQIIYRDHFDPRCASYVGRRLTGSQCRTSRVASKQEIAMPGHARNRFFEHADVIKGIQLYIMAQNVYVLGHWFEGIDDAASTNQTRADEREKARVGTNIVEHVARFQVACQFILHRKLIGARAIIPTCAACIVLETSTDSVPNGHNAILEQPINN